MRTMLRPWQVVLVGVLVFLLLFTPVMSVQAAPAEVVIFDLIFSEYIEGSGDDKAIEIFNSSPYAVDLSGYSLQISFNGGSSTRELTLSGQLAHGSTFVIVNNRASTALKDIADVVWGQLNFDGNDTILLKHNGSVIDSIGQLGHDPGTAWSNNGVSTLNSTLRKNALFCFMGDDYPNDPFSPNLIWSSAGVDNFSDLGVYSCWLSASPDPDDQDIELYEDESIVITLNGTWVTEDDIYQVSVEPLKGSLSGTAPDLIYTPDQNVFGSDQFEFVIIDGETGESSDPATVSINILAVNDQPIADAQTVQVNEDDSLEITLSGSDVETAYDALVFNVVDGPTNGTLTGTEPNLTYAPDADYFGPDSFTFTVSDGELTSEAAAVTIDVLSVNDVPEAFAQSVTVGEDGTVDIVLTGDDLETENTSLIFAIDTLPLNGDLILNGNTATYQPAENYNGLDSFTFTVDDGEDISEAAAINITINPVNDQPVADSAFVELDEDDSVAITLTGSDDETSSQSLMFAVVDGPSHGVLTGTAPNLTYEPDADYFGPDSFTFTVSDGDLISETATITIDVLSVNDLPVADAQAVIVDEDSSVEITLTGSDVETVADDLIFVIDQVPTNGSLTLIGTTATYTPNENYNGPDRFIFTISDGEIVSEPGLVTITVNPVNDKPVAVSDTGESYAVAADLVLTMAAPGVLANDHDVDGDALEAVLVDDVLHGILTLNSDGSFTYDPDDDYVGLDTFTYKASDGALESDVVTVTILVTAPIPVTSGIFIYIPIILR